jgi:ABC-type glycerol-3-phosphate transport system permease component
MIDMIFIVIYYILFINFVFLLIPMYFYSRKIRLNKKTLNDIFVHSKPISVPVNVLISRRS